MSVIWEAGVYQALARTNKPKAKPFQKKLYEEILPQIRKTVYNRINTEKLQRVDLSESLTTQGLDPAHDTVYEVVINNTRVTLLTEEWIVEKVENKDK